MEMYLLESHQLRDWLSGREGKLSIPHLKYPNKGYDMVLTHLLEYFENYPGVYELTEEGIIAKNALLERLLARYERVVE